MDMAPVSNDDVPMLADECPRRLFHGGTGTAEVVATMAASDLAVLVMVEPSHVRSDGHDEPRPWILRTTQVFRRDGDRWVRLHRRADPPITRRSLAGTLVVAGGGVAT
jgi:hypothetical protein